MERTVALIETPLGIAAAELDETRALTRLALLDGSFEEHLAQRAAEGVRLVRDDAAGTRLARELGEYFAGTRRAFEQPIRPEGTEFQRLVWRELLAIPFGATRTYGELASALDRPGASRAVGAANGANPIPILVPCHRVVAAGGGLGGYSAGLERKRRLLELEGVVDPLPAAVR